MVKAPKVVKMNVYPLAGMDSPLLTLSGCHAPYFTRNLVVLEDEYGHIGVGEIHGGEYITQKLVEAIPYVVGSPVSEYRSVLTKIRRQRYQPIDGEGLQGLDLTRLKFVVQYEVAIECAMLDLFGQFLELPIAALLGEGGKQRDEVEFLGYLFYTADSAKIDLPYETSNGIADTWEELRRTEMLTPEALVKQAQSVYQKYGFTNFKLKGGVLSPQVELETVKAIKTAFPSARVNIDPNGAWNLEEAIYLCKQYKDVLTYVEDPCGPQAGFSSREIMAEFKDATGLPVATNMIATNWRQFHHAAVLRAVDIVLADPHFWSLDGAVRMGYLLRNWGLTWGSHSNNHFDITLATFAQVAAACPGEITPVDTHWIWQDGQSLLKKPLVFQNGKLKITDRPGLGIEVDLDKVQEAHQRYLNMNQEGYDYRNRDDAMAMQFLEKDWKFDAHKPVFCHH